MRGSITSYIDVAQVMLYAFFIFFAGLIYYLRREDKREGYPLETDFAQRGIVQGFPAVPAPKTFKLSHGGTYSAPNSRGEPPLAAAPVAPWPGAPLEPTGNPMVDGVGPASYALRADVPEMTLDNRPLIGPMRLMPEAFVSSRDPDPRGMAVVGADRRVAGTVRDLWIDRAEPQIRYLEVQVVGGSSTVLLPITFARINQRRREVKVRSILAGQFASVPGLKNPDQVTKREEDRIMAYYASGNLYATPARLGPFL